MTITVNGLGELKVRAGQHLGYTSWLQVDQDRINTFADARSCSATTPDGRQSECRAGIG